jgi:hypothetical protein
LFSLGSWRLLLYLESHLWMSKENIAFLRKTIDQFCLLQEKKCSTCKSLLAYNKKLDEDCTYEPITLNNVYLQSFYKRYRREYFKKIRGGGDDLRYCHNSYTIYGSPLCPWHILFHNPYARLDPSQSFSRPFSLSECAREIDAEI